VLSEYSGVAAVVPRGQPVEPPIGEGIMNMAEKILAIRSAQKQQAMVQLEGVHRMAKEIGFMMDPKKYAQLVKKTGLPISMKDEDVASAIVANKLAGADTSTRQGASEFGQKAQQAGAQAQQQVSNLKPEEKMGMWVNQMAAQARRMINLKAMTDEQKGKFEADVTALKSKVLEGGPEGDKAAGKLITLGELKFDMSAATWYNSDEKGRGKILSIAQGAETDAQKAGRGDVIGASLMPYFDNKADALNAGHIMAEGGALPADLQGRMKKYSFTDLVDQAKIAGNLIDMGIPSSQIKHMSEVASKAGLLNALPAGMKSVGMKQLEIEQARLGIEKERYQKEVEIAQRATLAEMRKEITAEQRANLDTFKGLVELKKAGGSIDADLLKGAEIKAADALNMDTQEVNTLFNFLTGGTYLKFTPRLEEGGPGAAAVKKFGTKPGKTNLPSIIERIGRIKKDQEPI
jgi:hypothetical protein